MPEPTPHGRTSSGRRRRQPAARSNYRQVRLTLTHETGGRVSYSLYAKGLNQQWDEHQCLVRDSILYPPPLATTDDVIRCLIEVLKEQVLPGSLD